jgi:transposase-like protein
VPVQGQTATSPKVIARTIERYKRGERVVALAKELGVSEAGVYLWIKAEKAQQLERLKRADMTPQAAEKADKRDLAVQIKELRAENTKLRNRLLELMLKYEL